MGCPRAVKLKKERKKEKDIRLDHSPNPPPSASVAAVLPSCRVYSEGFGAVPSFLEGRIGAVVSGEAIARGIRWCTSPVVVGGGEAVTRNTRIGVGGR